MAEKYQHKVNHGSAFLNEKKSKDTDPTWFGTFDNNGEAFRVVIWENPYGDGTRLSFLIESEADFQEKKEARGGEKTANGAAGAAQRAAAAFVGKPTKTVARRRNY